MSDILPLGWRNGQVIPILNAGPSIASISLHMGTGVFDGLMAYWTGHQHHLFRPHDHFDRFVRSAANMGMTIPWDVSTLHEAAEDMVRQCPGQTCYIRPIAYRGAPELWLTGAEGRPVDLAMFGVPTTRLLGKPISCHLSKVERVSGAAMPISWKVCGLYVNSYLARRGAETANADDALMLDRHGMVAEASAANIFLLNRDGLRTPALSGDVFPGITRDTVLSLCRRLAIPCNVGSVAPGELDDAEGAFLCSTLMELRPITNLCGRKLETPNDPRFRAIVSAFEGLTTGDDHLNALDLVG